MPRAARHYQLTAALVAASVGAGVLCLADAGMGRSYRLHAQRPGAILNRRAMRLHDGRIAWRSDLPSSAHTRVEPVDAQPALVRVDICGPIEQRAGHHDPCAGWSDGHDAIAERLCAAFEEGDVLLVVDSPGGACAGLQQGIDRALKAKAAHGRRVTVWADEMIGSAAFWWAAAIGNEIFTPTMGQLGSIGARGGHMSVAGALARDGLDPTFFVWPDAGKIAFAPELPLSEEGARRGDRDVAIAGEAFAAAVVASPIGQRRGLTREMLVALSADVLTGQTAVDAGLADGVSTADEVIAYALAMAERATKDEGSNARASTRSGGNMPKNRKARAGKRAEDERHEDERYEDPPPPEGEEDQPGARGEDMPEGEKDKDKPDAEEPDAEGEEELENEEELEDEPPPPSSKPQPMPKKMSSDATMAEILGLPAGASLPAQRSAAIELRQIRDHAAKLTGQHDAAAIVGGLSAIAHDAAESARLRGERDKLAKEQRRKERMSLAHRLASLGVAGHERGRIFLDVVNPDGKPVVRNRKPVVRLAPVYAEMKLGTLRGMVEGFERNTKPRDPYEPNKEAAQNAARTGGLDTAARIERARSHPTVKAAYGRAGNTLTLDQIAASFVASNFDISPGA